MDYALKTINIGVITFIYLRCGLLMYLLSFFIRCVGALWGAPGDWVIRGCGDGTEPTWMRLKF